MATVDEQAHVKADDVRVVGLRVLVYAMNYAPEPIGCGRYTGEIGAELARRGALVTVVTTPPHYPGWRIQPGYANRYTSERRDGARVIRCPAYLREGMKGIHRMMAPFVFALLSAPVVLWQLLMRRYDVIICVEPTLFAAPLAVIAARLRGVTSLLHVQDLEVDAAFEVGHLNPPALLKRLAYGFERWTMRRFDRVVTISEAMRRRLIAKGLAPARVTLLRNWVNLRHIRPLPVPNAYRRELAVPDDRFVVLYSGNLGHKQGLDTLGQVAIAMRDDPHVFFVFAGDGPERETLQQRYGHLPNLVFHPLQPEKRLGDFLNMADLHVIPQLADASDFALPSKLAGILASGRPLVIMATPGQEIAQFVGDSAFVIPAERVDAMVDAIEAARRGDPPEQRLMRLKLASTLSRERAFDRLVGIILEGLDRRRKCA